MDSKEAVERLFKYYNHYIKDKEYLLIDVESEEWKAIFKDLEEKEKQDKVLEIIKPHLKQSLKIEKIDLTKEENRIYKGYLPKDYNKTYIYKWDYNYSVWDVFRNEENAILLKEWLDGKD